MKDFITLQDAADLIGVTKSYVSRLLARGKVEGEKLHQRAWLVSRKSAIAFRDSERKMGRPIAKSKSTRRTKTAS